jgi:hypothetical protein
MNRPEFERQMATLRERIAELPVEQRAALEALAQETAERHDQIRRSSLDSFRALERLELAFERFGDACQRLVGIAGDAQLTLERVRAMQRPEPGRN